MWIRQSQPNDKSGFMGFEPDVRWSRTTSHSAFAAGLYTVTRQWTLSVTTQNNYELKTLLGNE